MSVATAQYYYSKMAWWIDGGTPCEQQSFKDFDWDPLHSNL